MWSPKLEKLSAINSLIGEADLMAHSCICRSCDMISKLSKKKSSKNCKIQI